jgi:N-acetylglucosamine malate deacetylase 1
MKESIKIDVMAIFSHPDDAELSVAGTLIMLKSIGYRTAVVDMTRGEMGTRGTVEIRAKEAEEAARLMNLDLRVNLEEPDGHLWPTEEVRRKVSRLIRTYSPKLIFTPHWDDPHPDHANTSRIVREAARLASMKKYDAQDGLDAVRMPVIVHSIYSRLVLPSFIVDVSNFVDEKMKAIKAHVSQFYSAESAEPQTRISQQGFLEQIEYRMRYYGSLINCAAGEPFYVREALNVDDPVALLTRPMNIYS